MTYPNDPNLNRDPGLDRTNRGMARGSGYTGWIIGVIVLVAIVIAIVATTDRGPNSNTASNVIAPASKAPAMTSPAPTAAPPATTGSGTTSPQPAAPAAPAR
ncbi:MAG: hypothetical protein WA792_08690 [Pseudolabrys sp.]|jgi:hypothetical protein